MSFNAVLRLAVLLVVFMAVPGQGDDHDAGVGKKPHHHKKHSHKRPSKDATPSAPASNMTHSLLAAERIASTSNASNSVSAEVAGAAAVEADDDAIADAAAADAAAVDASPASEGVASATSLDVDTDMPYGELEPFGREDTAQELTEGSIKESDAMVDQLERAEVAEEKRAVFRALTRLRGAAITSFDGVARSQTGNIDEYNKVHKWRNTHPLRHLADEEADVSKWAFPDDADF